MHTRTSRVLHFKLRLGNDCVSIFIIVGCDDMHEICQLEYLKCIQLENANSNGAQLSFTFLEVISESRYLTFIRENKSITVNF